MKSGSLKIGIQGGRGSFNEQALKHYLQKEDISDTAVEIKYLFKTDRVLSTLLSGEIDRWTS
jgi:prephenate dehydratase